MSTSTPWSDNWVEILYHGLERLGYETVTKLVRNRDGRVTFYALADEIGDGYLAPKQIEIVMRSEAKTDGEYIYFAKTALVSCLREMLPRSNPSLSAGFNRIHPLVAWNSMISDSLEAQCSTVIERILSHLEDSADWVPSSTHDPVIESAFAGLEFPLPTEYQ